MNVATYTGTVKGGQIQLADNVRLPEDATVFVVVPGETAPSPVGGPRLVHPEQAADFVKKVIEDAPDA